ncbi:unnamed protein product, partial [Meganyctiphanes norvegica]
MINERAKRKSMREFLPRMSELHGQMHSEGTSRGGSINQLFYGNFASVVHSGPSRIIFRIMDRTGSNRPHRGDTTAVGRKSCVGDRQWCGGVVAEARWKEPDHRQRWPRQRRGVGTGTLTGRRPRDGDSHTNHNHVEQTKDDGSPLHNGPTNPFRTPVPSEKAPENNIAHQESNLSENSCGMHIVVTQDQEDNKSKTIRGYNFRKRSFSSMKSGSINSGSVNSDGSGYHAGSSWALGVPDCSDFERVWETAPEVIIKAARLASAETLTPSDASSFSSLPHAQPYHSPVKTPSSLLASSVEPNPTNPFSETPNGIYTHHSYVEWRCDNRSIVGEVGGIGHACSCGIRVEDEYIGKHCSACMEPNPVYYSEQFPSNDLLEDFEIDGTKHTLHVDLNTGAVKLHLHVHHKCGVSPTDTAEAYIDNKCPKHLAENNIKDLPSTSNEPQGNNEPNKIKFCEPFGFSSGIGEPSVYHALVVIFLEFFAWGLLTSPMISVLNDTFPDHTFLMNGLIVGIKGILSFLSAPLIGALSDVWGRKFFLFITVFFTCLPIPFMKINTWWYFALISMSGVFAVTFSIVFAYVADVTNEEDRSAAYGLVSATFAASLVTSPALGAYLGAVHSDDLVVGLATAIAILDVFFILVAVPESLPEKLRLSSTWSANITWEQADPFTSLLKIDEITVSFAHSIMSLFMYIWNGGEILTLILEFTVILEFTLMLRFIVMLRFTVILEFTVMLNLQVKTLNKVLLIGLVFEMLQLMWYGFGSQMWMMWGAGLLASVSSITYPAISAYVSTHTEADKQGVVQGIITGMRGLCSGLGPAMYGFIFYMFHVDLNDEKNDPDHHHRNGTKHQLDAPNLVPGPPFVFGSLMVICALMVAAFIPEPKSEGTPKRRKQSAVSSEVSYKGHKKKDSLDAASLPLMEESGVL